MAPYGARAPAATGACSLFGDEPKTIQPTSEARTGAGARGGRPPDDAVYQILQKLKAGTPVRLPGLGILRPGPKKSVLFDELQAGEEKGRVDASKKQVRR